MYIMRKIAYGIARCYNHDPSQKVVITLYKENKKYYKTQFSINPIK